MFIYVYGAPVVLEERNSISALRRWMKFAMLFSMRKPPIFTLSTSLSSFNIYFHINSATHNQKSTELAIAQLCFPPQPPLPSPPPTQIDNGIKYVLESDNFQHVSTTNGEIYYFYFARIEN